MSEWLKLTTQETADVGKNVEKGEPFCTAGRNVNWCSHSGKQYGGSSKKLKMELAHDPATALLSIYPKDTKMLTQRGTCTPMFIAALSTIAKVWKQPKCPSMDEWIKKMWYICVCVCVCVCTHTYIHTVEYCSAIRKNEIVPFATTWMELEGIMLSEIREKQIS